MVKKRGVIFDKYKPDMPKKKDLGIDLAKILHSSYGDKNDCKTPHPNIN